jgi:branched-chain amino acid transport system ATP-binding protein
MKSFSGFSGFTPPANAVPIAIALLALVSSALVFMIDSYSLLVMTLVLLSAVVGVGLNILMGLSGQISFGHVAFYAIGAYSSALLTMAGVPFALAMILAGLFTGLTGALLAIPALRVRGPYLAMITIAFAFMVHHSLIEWRSLTGGATGLIGIPMPTMGNLDPAVGMALIATGLAVAAFSFFYLLQKSGWGKAIRAVMNADIAASSLGFNALQTKTLAFALSALLTGLAGAIFAPVMLFVSPETFPFSQSILFVLAVIVGGTGTVFGPLLGAILIILVPELLSGFAEFRLLIFSCVLLAVLWIAPKGILGTVQAYWFKRAKLMPPKKCDKTIVAEYLERANGAMEGLVVKDLSIRFGGVQAAKDVSFEAPLGSITSIIGPNGAGKTTVLNMISGFYAPSEGSIELGQRLEGQSAWRIARAGVARTYQTTQLFGDMTVLENVLVATQQGRLKHPIKSHSLAEEKFAMNLLALVGYKGSVNTLANELAHVDRRLVEIARALASCPQVLLLDEPAAGLSSEDTAKLVSLLKSIAEFGIAVILVEHDMSLVMEVSDQILVLDSGQSIAWGKPEDIRTNEDVIRAYLGSTDYQAPPRHEPWQGSKDATLIVKNLVVDYGAAPVVEGVNLLVNPGELIAILGANGAGKSSILQALAGLHNASGGDIILNNENIEMAGASHIASMGLALVPEGRQVFPELTVKDNLLMGAYSRRDLQNFDQDIEDILKRFPRLKDRIDSPAGLLSGGEQQMLAVGRGLMARPSILLLDEPSLGLAPSMVAELYDALAVLRDEGVTLLLVDQMANLALQVADRAYVIETGKVVKSGTAEELKNDPELIAAYLGQDVA